MSPARRRNQIKSNQIRYQRPLLRLALFVGAEFKSHQSRAALSPVLYGAGAGGRSQSTLQAVHRAAGGARARQTADGSSKSRRPTAAASELVKALERSTSWRLSSRPADTTSAPSRGARRLPPELLACLFVRAIVCQARRRRHEPRAPRAGHCLARDAVYDSLIGRPSSRPAGRQVKEAEQSQRDKRRE